MLDPSLKSACDQPLLPMLLCLGVFLGVVPLVSFFGVIVPGAEFLILFAPPLPLLSNPPNRPICIALDLDDFGAANGKVTCKRLLVMG